MTKAAFYVLIMRLASVTTSLKTYLTNLVPDFLRFHFLRRKPHGILEQNQKAPLKLVPVPKKVRVEVQPFFKLELPIQFVDENNPIISEQKISWFPEALSLVQSFLLTTQSPHTGRAYKRDLQEFIEVCLANFKLPPWELGITELAAFRKSLQGVGPIARAPLSDLSVNRKMAALKSFYNHMVEVGKISRNPLQSLRALRVQRESPTQELRKEEIRKIHAFHPKSRTQKLHRAMLFCLLYMGLRRSELVALAIKDLQCLDNEYFLKVRGKGNKERLLAVPKVVFNAIEDYLVATGRHRDVSQDEPLFCAVNTINFLSADYVYYIVKKYTETDAIGSWSPHSFRATCITNAMDNGATHREVQHLAGWSSPGMVMAYDKRMANLRNKSTEKVHYDLAQG